MSHFDLQFPSQKTVVITGASTGIGKALAYQLARSGSRLVLTARNREKLEAVSRGIPNSLAVVADVTLPEDRDRLIKTAYGHFGSIDVLVNNAGYGITGSVEEVPVDEVRKLFETNVLAPIALIQLALPYLRKNNAHRKNHLRGMIVNIESIVALRSFPYASAYDASKHALHAFSESLRLELIPDNIGVISICPGLTETDFFDNKKEFGRKLDNPKQNIMSAERCAELIVKAIRNGQRQVTMTSLGKLMYVLQRFSPSLLDELVLIYARMREKRRSKK